MSIPATNAALVPVRKSIAPLALAEIGALLASLPQWVMLTVDGVAQLQRCYSFRNFADALAFANQVGAMADAADHHPALTVEWGKVTVRWWTHTVHGLHANDFVMATRTEQVYADGR